MTGMLASVTSIAEAAIVLTEGVDLVDLKDPHAGALGALETDEVAGIVARVNGVIPVSATAGDIQPDDPELPGHIDRIAAAGVDIIKVGLFASHPTSRFIDAIRRAADQNIKLVIVLFAENYAGNRSFEPLLQTGIHGIMLDTRDKSGRSLRAVLTAEKLEHFVRTVKDHALLSGLAGSLRYRDVHKLLQLRPDYLGFRGALCSKNSRVNRIDRHKVNRIRTAIPPKRIINHDHSKDEVLKNGTMA